MADRGYIEADWQVFRKRVPDWQESYTDKPNREYIQLLSEDGAPSEKFWNTVPTTMDSYYQAAGIFEVWGLFRGKRFVPVCKKRNCLPAAVVARLSVSRVSVSKYLP